MIESIGITFAHITTLILITFDQIDKYCTPYNVDRSIDCKLNIIVITHIPVDKAETTARGWRKTAGLQSQNIFQTEESRVAEAVAYDMPVFL